MREKSVLKEIQERIQQDTQKENVRLEKEKDPVKQAKLGFEIQRKTTKIVLDEIKKRSERDFERWMEEVTHPFTTQYFDVEGQIDDIALNISKNSKEYDAYKKIQNIKKKFTADFFSDLDDPSLKKKHLERFLVLLILGAAETELQSMKNIVEYNELGRAFNLVKRRFHFDHNWFTCLGLIQLHENLIKKKIVELGGEIKGDEPIRVLIIKLSKLIKQKEKRDVTLDLLMSEGLKKIRDLMTHGGYKQKVYRITLKKITKDIEELESLLFQEKFSIFT